MITEVKERRVKMFQGGIYFHAVVRDGKVVELSRPYKEDYATQVSIESIQLYIAFLKEVLEAIAMTEIAVKEK